MKNRYCIFQKGVPLMLFGAACIFSFSSCVKDTGPVEDYSQSPPVISFQCNGQGSNSQSVGVLGTSSEANPSLDSVEVSLGTANLYLSAPVTVTIAPDQGTLDNYNQAHGTSYTILPSADYTIQDNGTIVIAPGKNLVNFAVSFFGSGIDFSQGYALPLLITQAKGGGSVVATNLNYFILIVTPANQYSGNYSAAGTRTLYAGPTISSGVAASSAVGGTVPMSYVNDSTSEVQLADLAGDFMDLTVHGDGSVTVGPTTNSDPTFASLANNGPCTYSAGVFSLNYLYYNGSGNIRTITETLTKQ